MNCNYHKFLFLLLHSFIISEVIDEKQLDKDLKEESHWLNLDFRDKLGTSDLLSTSTVEVKKKPRSNTFNSSDVSRYNLSVSPNAHFEVIFKLYCRITTKQQTDDSCHSIDNINYYRFFTNGIFEFVEESGKKIRKINKNEVAITMKVAEAVYQETDLKATIGGRSQVDFKAAAVFGKKAVQFKQKMTLYGKPTINSKFACSVGGTGFKYISQIKRVAANTVIMCNIIPKGYGPGSLAQEITGIDADPEDFQIPYFTSGGSKIETSELVNISKTLIHKDNNHNEQQLQFKLTFKGYKKTGTYCMHMKLSEYDNESSDNLGLMGSECFLFEAGWSWSDYKKQFIWATIIIILIMVIIYKFFL